MKLSYRIKFFFSLLVLLAGCAPQKPTIGIKEVPPTDNWVEETIQRLTLEEKVAQMVVPKVFGLYTSAQSDDWKRVVRLVKERKIGGIAVFVGEVYETALIINRLQELADVPLLVSADFERGLAMRTRRTTAFPEAMAVAATRNPELAYTMGRIVAKEARAIGVHQNLAPVADLNINPDNPVINVRSYGENPRLVAEIAAAYAKGLQDGGVVATAKHFPGHGDTNVDSHLGLPVLNISRSRLDSIELVPFKKLIQRGVKSVMIAHVAVPAIDSSEFVVSTLSPNVVTNLLGKELGFHGLVVSDAMEMLGLLKSVKLDEAVVKAVEAGIDVILAPPVGGEDTVIDALRNAVQSGRLSTERIDASVRKILAIKKSLQLDEQRFVNISAIGDVIGIPEHWEFAKQIARASITVMKNDNVLPIQRLGFKRKILLVVISDNDDYRTEVHRPSAQIPNERVGNYFALQLRRRYPNMETVHLDPRTNTMEADSILKLSKTADLIICPVYVKARSASGKFGLPQQVIDAANLLGAQGKPTVFIAMGSPYILGSLKNGNAYMCAYSDGEVTTEAVVEALFGEIPVSGRLPVTIPGMFPLGSGFDIPPAILREDLPASVGVDSTKLALLDSIINHAISDSAFPGAGLLVAKNGSVIYNKTFGTLDYSPGSQRVNTQTMYDLASLTKVVATTNAVMKLDEEGKLKLDDPVVRYQPEFGKRGKEKITIRNLLMHNAGLPAFKRLYLTCKTAKEALDSVYNSELIYPPGDSTVYSDFGFIVLGKVVEKITGKPLDRYVAQVFFQPLGMQRTMFNPPESLWSNIAPTEVDTAWRNRLVLGTVHDETAALLGGVAGHAGLFSSASDLAVFMQMLMNGGFYGTRNFLKPETVSMFTSRQDSKNTRALGWDTKTSNGYSSAGTLFSDKAFGHTGFTGTSIWTDPGRNLFVIFLTNRVYPTRENTKIYKVRPVVHDAVVNALKKDMLFESRTN